MRRRATLTLGLTLGALLAVVAGWPGAADPPTAPAGRSVTLLPDGRWLFLGGETATGVQDTVEVWEPGTQGTTRRHAALQHARAWHSATVLPDGRVLILGGVGADGRVVDAPEVFVPATNTVDPFPDAGPTPRIGHTATVLTDGRLLIAGGVGLDTAELWDPASDTRLPVTERLGTPRARHAATLLASGEVLLSGGVDAAGQPIATHEVYDPVGETFTAIAAAPPDSASGPEMTGSVPADGATDVPVRTIIGIRFSMPLTVQTLTPQTVFLSGPGGLEPAGVVPAEGGRLLFVVPEGPLVSGTRYTVTLNGPTDPAGQPLPFTTFTFETPDVPTSSSSGNAGDSTPLAPSAATSTPYTPLSDRAAALDDERWVPTSGPDGWRTNRPPSPWESLPLLQADPGITALAGRALTLAGTPLPHVTLEIAGRKARTDATGRFLLRHIPPDHQELLIDGRTASRPGRTFGVFEVGVVIYAGRTIGLPYTIWMPRIDTDNAVTIASPTIHETLVTSPHIPGLEVRLPASATITDHEHRPVTKTSITAIPLDRPPFPLPLVEPPAYFTIQPGGGHVYGPNGGARVIYPNTLNWRPDDVVHFWSYAVSPLGWHVYGDGRVTRDGTRIVPDVGVAIYQFTGAMAYFGPPPPPDGPPYGGGAGEGGGPPEPPENPGDDGEPVDLSTGLFVMEKTDIALLGLPSIRLKRTYRTRDSIIRPFGRGATHPYAMFLRAVTSTCEEGNLVLPDGGRIHLVRISSGTGCGPGAVFEHTETPTRFYKARVEYDPLGYWRMTLIDGTRYTFSATDGWLAESQDRFGNTVRITGDSTYRLIENSTGRWLRLSTDPLNNSRITQTQDNLGRMVGYTYDASGRLSTVTDPAGGVTEYTYDAFDRMLTIKDPRNIVYLTNEYDAAGRVIKQTQADGTTFQFVYTLDASGKITQTDVTNPRGYVRRVTFNGSGYVLTDTSALGTPQQQTTTYERELGTNRILAITNPLGHRTAYAFNSQGRTTSMTRMAGTPDAVTTTYTYEPIFNQVATITDPLNHTKTLTYASNGALTSITDPLNHQITFTASADGQPTQISAPLGVTMLLTYESGDLVATTDALSNVSRRVRDSAGRLVAATDAGGRTVRYEYDSLSRLTRLTDPLSGTTSFVYGPNGNLLSLTDPRGGVVSYTYNNMDRLITRTDPLLRQETYQYDANGNLTQITDRKGQVTTFTYDAVDRRTQTAIAGGATTSHGYDAGNRLTSVVDSVAGTITRTYDSLNRLTQEITPHGTVSYTYDAAGRRATMSVGGQPSVSYTYNNADRLTQMTQGSSTVALAYDAVGRRTSLTLPNGIVIAYAYDTAFRLIGLTYTLGSNTLGTLTYTYDAAGNRSRVGGTWARANLPSAVSTASYNAANQQLTFGPNAMTYDNNGNVATLTDASGVTTYTWDARNRLTAMDRPALTATFGYDGVGRRRTKTINGARTDFLYDGLNPIQEGTLPGSPGANLLTGLPIDEYFTRADATGTSSFLVDALGSTVALSDAAGTVQTQYTYEPFGSTTISGTPSGSAFQFTRRENDGTGLYFYRARYFAPGLGRFLSEDPGGLRDGANVYLYGRNNPLMFTDPSGLFVKNETLNTIYVKPSEEADSDKPRAVEAGDSYPFWLQDGVAVPCGKPNYVFKVVDFVLFVTVSPPAVIYMSPWDLPQRPNEWFDGGWKDEKWVNDNPNWRPLFETSRRPPNGRYTGCR